MEVASSLAWIHMKYAQARSMMMFAFANKGRAAFAAFKAA